MANFLGTGHDDALTGGTGNDKLEGYAGNDILDGGLGDDSLSGGEGDDLYIVDSAKDKIKESLSQAKNGGIDLVQASVNFTLGVNLENLTLTGSGDIAGKGNALANTILGNSGNNVLDGGQGADYLAGGLGNDIYLMDNSGDFIDEKPNEGIDTLKTSLAISTLLPNVENYIFTGKGHWTFAGDSADNQITGGAGSDYLMGMAGDDILDGGKNVDLLIGGAGNDTYWLDNAADRVIEAPNEGLDTIIATVSVDLLVTGANVEFVTLKSKGAINAFGDSAINFLMGDIGKNILDGRANADIMIGGDGDDTYIVDNPGDQISETNSTKAGGIDTVRAAVDFTLGANCENLVLTGVAALQGTGNSLDNIITGNAGDNILNGGGGKDILAGGLGDDHYIMTSDANDRIIESAKGGIDTVEIHGNFHFDLSNSPGIEILDFSYVGNFSPIGIGNNLDNHIIGSANGDWFFGGNGNDIIDGAAAYDDLNGGGGDDILNGGDGNDYLGGNAGDDVLIGGNGIDRLHGGADADTLNGDAGADYLSGDAGDDILNGGLGDDELLGSSGIDTLSGDAGNDTLEGDSGNDALNGGDGTDFLEGASGNDTLDGGNGDDFLEGDSGNDTLNGGNGNDSLDGYSGNDFLIGGNGNDYFDGWDGNDTLTGGAGRDNFYFWSDNYGYVDVITDYSLIEFDNIWLDVDIAEDYRLISDPKNAANTILEIDTGHGFVPFVKLLNVQPDSFVSVSFF